MLLRLLVAFAGVVLLILSIACFWQGVWMAGVVCLGLAVAVAGQVVQR